MRITQLEYLEKHKQSFISFRSTLMHLEILIHVAQLGQLTLLKVAATVLSEVSDKRAGLQLIISLIFIRRGFKFQTRVSHLEHQLKINK